MVSLCQVRQGARVREAHHARAEVQQVGEQVTATPAAPGDCHVVTAARTVAATTEGYLIYLF